MIVSFSEEIEKIAKQRQNSEARDVAKAVGRKLQHLPCDVVYKEYILIVLYHSLRQTTRTIVARIVDWISKNFVSRRQNILLRCKLQCCLADWNAACPGPLNGGHVSPVCNQPVNLRVRGRQVHKVGLAQVEVR